MKMPIFNTIIALVLLLTGCSTSANQSATQISTSSSIDLFTATSTLPAPPMSPSPTQTLAPIPSTLTPFPVLSSDEATAKLLELLQTNGGCHLPCFLGYTPAEANQMQANQFFNQFVNTETPNLSISKPQAGDNRSISFYFLYKNLYFNIGVSMHRNGDRIDSLEMDSFSQPKWNSSYAKVMSSYMLPQVLVDYGKPTQVLIETFRNDSQRPDVTSWPFFLVLLYQDQGFYLNYKMERVSTGAEFLGCPSKSFVSVGVWDPRSEVLFKKMMQVMTNGGDLRDHKSISDATSMSLDEFYETFKDPKNTRCLRTPIETWPNP